MRNFIVGTVVWVGVFGGAAQANRPLSLSNQSSSEVAHNPPGERFASTTPGSPEPSEDVRVERKPASLTAKEISAGVTQHVPDIQRCYRAEIGEAQHANRLELTLVIAYNGRVRSVQASVPGLPAKPARKMESCIRTALEPARFPERRNDTMAVLPYYFQKTDAPDAGPQLSCWNPKGC